MRVLLVVNDPGLAATLARGMLQASVSVAVENTVDGARDRALQEGFDAVVVDAALPGGGGPLCRELRRRHFHFVIVMLADSQLLSERVHARSVDVDACVSKPVDVNELLLRLRSVTREPRPVATSPRVVVADLEIDFRARMVQRGDRPIQLTAKEFALLEILASNAGQAVGRDKIVAHVWADRTSENSNLLEVLVRRLRRKIDDGFDTKLVRTLRSTGYQLFAG